MSEEVQEVISALLQDFKRTMLMREYLLWVLAMHRDPTLGHIARIYWESDFVLVRADTR